VWIVSAGQEIFSGANPPVGLAQNVQRNL
jgi:hypothetical protein